MAWAPDYCTLAELKSFVKIESSDTTDDTELGLAITAASRAVDQRCGGRNGWRQFGKTVLEQRFYDAYFNPRRGRWMAEIDDLVDLTGLDVQAATGAVTLIRLEPINAVKKGKVFEQLVIDPSSPGKPSTTNLQLTISALWGWNAVPATVKDATLLQASRFFARRTSPYGIAGSPDQGGELRLLSRVDPDVAVALTHYVRVFDRVG